MRKALFLLGILNDSDLDWMIAVGAKREVPPGTVLIHEGQCVDAVFVIVEGLLARSSARCRLSTRVHISGRQRQRLLIARVLLRKPTLLILDEATIALDNRSQTIVTESLNRLKVTRILIAHRLSTIRQASRIYVIEAGRVVQHGTFEGLMKEEGLFARLMGQLVSGKSNCRGCKHGGVLGI